jgi:hypothetical protein
VDSTVSPFEKGAGPPLAAILAKPVTMKPGLVVAGVLTGHMPVA